MALTIKFNSPLKGLIPEPEPVINHIPKAYKQLSNSVDSNTVKKCMPFLDAMISGYILPIPVDYRYTYNFSEQRAIFDTNTNLPEHLKKYFEIGFHDNRQISEELMYENRTINVSNPRTPPVKNGLTIPEILPITSMPIQPVPKIT